MYIYVMRSPRWLPTAGSAPRRSAQSAGLGLGPWRPPPFAQTPLCSAMNLGAQAGDAPTPAVRLAPKRKGAGRGAAPVDPGPGG